MTKQKFKITAEKLRNKRKIGHGRIKRFARDRFLRLSRSSWRKPKGIDNPMKRKYRGRGKMNSIGYGSDKRLKHRNAQSGKYRFRIRNISQLETLLMHNKDFEAVIARQVGARKRKDIVIRANELGVKVVNNRARLNIIEKE